MKELRIIISFVISFWSLTVLAQPTIVITSSATSSVCVNDEVTFVADTSGCSSSASGEIEWFVNGTSVSVGDTNAFSSDSLSDGDVVTAQYICLDASGNGTDTASSNTVSLQVDDPMADAGEDKIIDLGDEVILEGSGNGTYSWGPAEGLSSTTVAQPSASPEVTTKYYLTVTDANGCVSTDEVTVAVIVLHPTNTFTPNGDGYNDTWDIGGINYYPSARVTVYDRWGQKVFNVTGYTEEKKWDGTNRGLKLPASTYYYVIDKNNNSNEPFFVGYVTIIK